MIKNKFQQIYLHMFFQEKGNIKITKEQYIIFLKESIKINLDVLKEQKTLLIDIPNELIERIWDFQKSYQLTTDQVKEYFKNSKHYYNVIFKNNINLFFKQFDFSNKQQIKSFLFETFNILDQQLLTEMYDLFKSNIDQKFDGFCNKFNDKYFCIINKQSEDRYLTIYHQLSHYLQLITNIRITKPFNEKLNNYHKKDLERFGLTENQIKYWFSPNQFYVHVDQLLIGLYNTFNNFYNDQHYFKFLDKVEQLCKLSKSLDLNRLKFNQLFINYCSVNNNSSPLLMLIGSYLLNYRYQKIKMFIFNHWRRNN